MIEADLCATQDELIQIAKLAVAGQTAATLAYEINQPLDALSTYPSTARRATEQTQKEQASMMLGKVEGVISRIDAIIRSLRQFTQRAELETSPRAADLAQMFSMVQEPPAMRHRSLQATLVLPQGIATVSGDEVRTQQVLINVPTNALDVRGQGAVTTVNW